MYGLEQHLMVALVERDLALRRGEQKRRWLRILASTKPSSRPPKPPTAHHRTGWGY